jgi:hypothetical protein
VKFVSIILFFALVTFTGCVTKSTAEAQARAAYLAGQKDAYKTLGAQLKVVVLGDVQRHVVPWVDGLTLSQAIATANYQGLHDPKDIIIESSNGAITHVAPKKLLNGPSPVLQPGDVITVVGQ